MTAHALDAIDADTLRRLYVEQGLTTTAVAAELGCGVGTIRRALRQHGIEVRGSA